MSLQAILRRLDAYERLVRLDKPIGTLLLLWPTLWALWIASGNWPRLDLLLIFVLGTFLMRSAGCAINDYADRRFDPHVERTRERPLAAGEIAPGEALALAGVLALAAFGLVLSLNLLSVGLSFIAVGLAAAYPFTKRFFAMPQAVLGIAFAFGTPMAYAAVLNRLPLECFWLMAATFCWIVAYDTEYAMVDRADDRKLGLHSAAILFGEREVAVIMGCYAAMLGLLALLGVHLELSWQYYAGLAAAGVIALYHYSLIRERSREGAFRAFRHNNWMGFAIFLGVMFAHPLPYGFRFQW